MREFRDDLDGDLKRRHLQVQWLYTTCMKTEPAATTQQKFGRNDLCPCGSGKKFKKCCGGSGAVVPEIDASL